MVETICFNFNARLPFPYVIKISRAFGGRWSCYRLIDPFSYSFVATKKLAKLAYRLATDRWVSEPDFRGMPKLISRSFRTLVNLQYPPHVVALGCLYLAALLSSFERGTSPERPGHNTAHQIAATLSASGEWGKQFQAHIGDIEEIAHAIIDLLIGATQNPAANTSPHTPSSPSPHLSHSTGQQALPRPPPVPYKADQLIRLKIVMRETEHPPRNRESATGGEEDVFSFNKSDSTLLGRNDKTVRFMFGPPAMVDDA